MLLTVAHLVLASEPTTTPFPAFDSAAAAQALQGTWPVSMYGTSMEVTFSGDQMTMKNPAKTSTTPFSVDVPCAISLKGEVGGATIAYALQGGKLEVFGGYAVKVGDSVYACMANYLFEARPDGSCVSWTWSQEEGKPREWTNEPATCTLTTDVWTMQGKYGDALRLEPRSPTFWATPPYVPPAPKGKNKK